ncbi:MAG: ATP-binding protein [Rubrivivax sp.]
MNMPPPAPVSTVSGPVPALPTSAGSSPAALLQQRWDWVGRSVGFGIWELDLETGQFRWDDQMWRLRGLEPQPGPIDGAFPRTCLHPDDRERIDQLMAQAAQGSAPFEYEFRVLRPDGQQRWLASRSIQTPAGADGAERRIGINWDITDSRNTETARQQQAMAEGELRAKAQFLARMSHELRTPLNAVLGFTELLLSRESGADAESALRGNHLAHVRTAGHQLLTLVDDVLDLSHVEGGEAQIRMTPVSVADLLAEVMPLLEPERVAAEVTVDTQLDAGPIMADAARLRQVLLNLLSNAIRCNRPGGHVRVESLNRGSGGSQRLLRISDSGRGMSEQQLLHLFEPFSPSGPRRDDGRGSGMGLAIVKALVERMGGTVHVDSREGRGSVFELRLAGAEAEPVSESSQVPAALLLQSIQGVPSKDTAAPPCASVMPSVPDAGPAGGPSSARQARHQLLYIEDNPVNALIISELLARRDDLTLAIATDGHSGVAEARRLQPVLILLDMQLPDVDGFEVLRQLRADPGTRSIPCVALSANAMPEDIQRALRAGMADYWTKPLDFKRFLTALDAMLASAA